MSTEGNQDPILWSESSSRAFIDYGRYLVPDREQQIQTLAALIPAQPGPFHVLELACGEGLLALAILERYPNAVLHGYDGSAEMLRAAQARLANFGERFQAQFFSLASDDWRRPEFPVQAIVSSLAIHHLDGPGKQDLFRDAWRMLSPGGALMMADVLQPASQAGAALAADALDEAVRQRCFAPDGNAEAFDFFIRKQWNLFRYPDKPIDQPSTLLDQLKWLEAAGFQDVDAFWMKAGHAIFGGWK